MTPSPSPTRTPGTSAPHAPGRPPPSGISGKPTTSRFWTPHRRGEGESAFRRDLDGLGVQVAIDAFGSQFAAITAALDAAEWRERVHAVALVDPERASADTRGDRHGSAGVAGPHRPGQAVVGIVGNAHRVILVAIRNDRGHRPANLIAR